MRGEGAGEEVTQLVTCRIHKSLRDALTWREKYSMTIDAGPGGGAVRSVMVLCVQRYVNDGTTGDYVNHKNKMQ